MIYCCPYILDVVSRLAADKFIVSALIDILISAPAGDVQNENNAEFSRGCLDVGDKVLQGGASVKAKAASAAVRIGFDEVNLVAGRVWVSLSP